MIVPPGVHVELLESPPPPPRAREPWSAGRHTLPRRTGIPIEVSTPGLGPRRGGMAPIERRGEDAPGDENLATFLPESEDDLRALARALLSRGRAIRSRATSLAHDTYLRLSRRGDASCNGHEHFLATSPETTSEADDARLLALDAALQRLSVIDERKARVVELRFFGELEVEEVARVLGVSRSTVKRDWSFARAWLTRALARS